jgi:hypothetical protein
VLKNSAQGNLGVAADGVGQAGEVLPAKRLVSGDGDDGQ